MINLKKQKVIKKNKKSPNKKKQTLVRQIRLQMKDNVHFLINKGSITIEITSYIGYTLSYNKISQRNYY